MEMKQIRIADYTISELRRIGNDIGNPIDDTVVRFLVSSYEISKLKESKNMFSGMTDAIQYRDFNEREQNEIVKQHEMKAVEIVAQVNYNFALGGSNNVLFAELIKEITILRNIADWKGCNILEGCAPEMVEEFKNREENYGEIDIEFRYQPETEDQKENRKKTKRFFEIIESRIENITEEMKTEAFELFTNAFDYFK